MRLPGLCILFFLLFPDTGKSQQETVGKDFFIGVQLGVVPFAEPTERIYPEPFTFREIVGMYQPAIGVRLGRKYKRFALEAGLEYYRFVANNQRHTRQDADVFYLYQYNVKGFLLSVPVLGRWQLGQKKLRFELESGIQFLFLQHRIEEGHFATVYPINPFVSSSPHQATDTRFLALPLPRIGIGFSYVPNQNWEYGMRFGLIGIPGLDLWDSLQLTVVRPF